MQDGLGGARENYFGHVRSPGGFENAVHTIDIYGQQFRSKIVFVRDGSEMNNGFGALAGGDHLLGNANVGLNSSSPANGTGF